MRDRSKESTGGCPARPGGRWRRAEPGPSGGRGGSTRAGCVRSRRGLRSGHADRLGPAGSGPAAAYAPAMPPGTASLPGDLAAAHAMILLERAARLEAEAAVSSARLEIERILLAKSPEHNLCGKSTRIMAPNWTK